MTIKELKEILNLFDENNDVLVFVADASSLTDVDSISNNNGNLQINVKAN